MIATICQVLTTAAVLALAVVAIRTMIRFEKMSRQIETTAALFSESIGDLKSATTRVNAMVASLDEAVDPLRRAAKELGGVGSRAAALSTAVLEELVAPLGAAIGIVRGLRAGAAYLADRMTGRHREDKPESG